LLLVFARLAPVHHRGR